MSIPLFEERCSCGTCRSCKNREREKNKPHRMLADRGIMSFEEWSKARLSSLYPAYRRERGFEGKRA
jgi:hypothetical protein